MKKVIITVCLKPPKDTDITDCKNYVLDAVANYRRRLPAIDPMSRLDVCKIHVDIVPTGA